jgi:hypothetical protein
MKTCSKCKTEKSLELFHRSSRSVDGRNNWCKACFAEYERERYHNGDKERKTRNKQATRKRAQDYLWSVLTTNSCVDCGNSDPEVLEFDHRDDVDKSYDVGDMAWYAVSAIKREIAKCDIRCANCHRKRTIKQFGLWRGERTNLGVG